MTTIIGLMGPAGSGKSTVAKHLIDRFGAKLYSLAGPLKAIAHDAFGFTSEQLYGTQEQKEAIDQRYGMSCRTFLQRLGTEGVRKHLGDDVWIKACLRKIKIDAPTLAVVDDLRFVNEASAFRNVDRDYPGINGYVWRLVPPFDATSKERARNAGMHASESEWSVAPYDVTLEPDKRGVPELIGLVDEVLRMGYPWLFPKRPETPL